MATMKALRIAAEQWLDYVEGHNDPIPHVGLFDIDDDTADWIVCDAAKQQADALAADVPCDVHVLLLAAAALSRRRYRPMPRR